ncbi:MAG: DUF5009 domain-containing protein [Opitutaceae bacterium]|nr:DUF5009 domain-containing protein [Opitutaceae bacterium]
MTDRPSPTPHNLPRIESLDIFRGLTMFLMLFVNDLNDPDLGHVADVPGWLRHMPAGVDGMTFVDVILPAFLFGAGLSIPLALGPRLVAGARGKAFRHVCLRSLGLVIIGLGMVNTYRFHPTAMPVSPGLWEFLFFSAVIMVWHSAPRRSGAPAGRTMAWRLAGAILLVGLAIIYRGSDAGGDPTWMRTSWWGILTIIGIAYFIGASAFLLFNKSLAGMIGLLGLLTAVNIGDRTGALAVLDPLRGYFSAAGLLGGLPSILVTGVIASLILFDPTSDASDGRRFSRLLGLGFALALAGLLLRPPFGISKPADTPAWCLLSAAICCALFAFLHWLVDVKRIGAWGSFVRAAGRQPLMAYFLPHMVYSLLAVLGVTWLEHHLNSGWPGILRSMILALGILWVTAVLARFKLNLKL